MKMLEYHIGCHNDWGCFGPKDNYYTIFNTIDVLLKPHLFYSILTGLLLFGGLFVLHRKQKIKISIIWLIFSTLLFTVFIFFILAYLFPVVVYF